MFSFNLPQQSTINQYVGDGVSIVYIYAFYIQQNPDTTYSIAVFVTPPGQTADPVSDLQVQGTAYTVQGAGTISGGTIMFQAGYIPANGSTVTLIRDIPNAIDTQFSVASNFSGVNLDAAFTTTMLCIQQNTTQIFERCLRYAVDAYLPSAENNVLPVLTNINQQVWMSQNGAIIAVLLEDSSDTSVLRSQLAVNTPAGADGSTLVGYNNGTPTTVHAELVSVDASIVTINNEIAALQNSPFYGATVYLAGNHAVPGSSTVIIGFDTVGIDANGLFVLADFGFRIKKAGVYFFNGIALSNITTPSSSSAILYLYKNGAPIRILFDGDQSGANICLAGASYDTAAIGDIYQLFYENDNTVTNTLLGGSVFTEFSIEFLGT